MTTGEHTIPHGLGGYTNHGCRCSVCRDGTRRAKARWDAVRRAERIEIDGRLFAVNAPRHGRPSTYANWACRCEPCTRAHREATARLRARRAGRGRPPPGPPPPNPTPDSPV